jgi:hypothetical protein
MASVVINGDTSGSVTLSAPATAGSTTLTLPTTSGTVLTSASSLTASMPAGSVIQTVSTTVTSGSYYASSTSVQSLATTGHAVTITPLYSNSKIYVTVSAILCCSGADTYNAGYCTIYRGATNLAANNTSSGFSCFGGNGLTPGSPAFAIAMQYLDSPATTSATTYTVYMTGVNANGTVYYCRASLIGTTAACTITAMEIKQ